MFPTVATTVINAVQEVVAKDKYVGAIVLSHGYLPRRDIFSGNNVFQCKRPSKGGSAVAHFPAHLSPIWLEINVAVGFSLEYKCSIKVFNFCVL